ncbi:hypothetical protein QVD17_18757 [Tagetes erecta]|uniref:Integrase catalytic domain-containing protein n=1 Tax=Tagetes erecta TaxID=13708 RepID=A0AAD8NWP4_TARER|nr:hypothetical protein QVD17_18757 [Tagetes erecta]
MAGDEEKKTDESVLDKKDEGVPNHNSPYYIHPSDYPRQMHVNDHLTDGNYIDWSQEMLNFLFAKNKVGFIDGSIKKPEHNSANYMPWMRCDAMIKGWLNTAMEKEIRTSVKYATSSQEIWADLKERFGKDSAPRAYELKQSLTATKQDGMSVSAYYTKLRALWDEIQSALPIPRCNCNGCVCGIGKKLAELKDKERLYEFLLGLDSDFGTIRTQILAMQPLPSLGTAYHLVADDEQQRAISNGKRSTTEPTAFKVFVPKNRDQKQSQYKSQKEGRRNVGEKVEHCDFCEKDGHNKDGCFKRIGYPEWWPGKGKQEKPKPQAACVQGEASEIQELTAEQYQQLLKFFGSIKQDNTPAANMANNGDEEGKWVIDSGATEHITHNGFLLKDKIKRYFEPPVVIPNGASIAVEGRGDYILPNGIKIKGVLHVPNFKCNLLSVNKLSKDLKCAVTFFPDFCVMQDLNSRTLIGVGNCKKGLYEVGLTGRKRQVMMATVDTWHNRLGHASTSKLSHVNFLKNVSFRQKDVCDSCIKAKFTRLPFPTSTTKTSACFDLLHCDVWGKYRTLSFTRASYFLTIVDDFSRAVWVFLLKHKDEASTRLIHFHKMVQTQFEKNIKRIRCDNGGEFTSNRMLDFYAKEGIILETTCAHTPQQNGVVERKHRHLLETARALKFEANLPTKFWGECVLTATYIINRLPSDVIENKTPYEILYNRQPEYEHMRVFGCLAYYKNTETKGDKFEQRGRVGVFLGYPPGTKGYKVFDAQHNKIVLSRDVKFFEKVFPFTKVDTREEVEDIFELLKQGDSKHSSVEEVIGSQPTSAHEDFLGQQSQKSVEGEHLETESSAAENPTSTLNDLTQTEHVVNQPIFETNGPPVENSMQQEDSEDVFVRPHQPKLLAHTPLSTWHPTCN